MKLKNLRKKYKERVIVVIGCVLIVVGIMGVVFSNFMLPAESDKLHFLCIGVDKDVPMDQRVEYSNSIGQADGVFLLSVDKKSKEMDIVSIPRDTMVTIEMYYSDLEYIGQTKAQICLQYAYADGLEKSCELMVDRVEELFEGIEIDGYVSINLAALYEINDAIGGVTLNVNDQLAANALGIEVGTSVTLNSENIPYYIRSREKQEAEGAYNRTLRYKEYITAFIPQALGAIKENPGIVLSLMDILKEHMVTDMHASDITALITVLMDMSMEGIDYHTLEGNVIMGANGYEEFYPDRIKLNILKSRIY